MLLKPLFLVFATLSLSSCATLYVKILTKKPKIESPQSITEFLLRNNFDTTNSYYLGGDINVTNKILKEHFYYNVFDSLGNQLYNADLMCNFKYLTAITSEHPDALLSIHPNNKTIFNLIEGAKKLDGTPFDRSILANHKYIVLVFWQKFMGGKKSYKEIVVNIVDELNKHDNILVLKINADMMAPRPNSSKTKFKIKLVDRNTKPIFQLK